MRRIQDAFIIHHHATRVKPVYSFCAAPAAPAMERTRAVLPKKQPLTETTKPKQSIMKVSFSDIPDNVHAVGMLQAYQEVEISSENLWENKKNTLCHWRQSITR